MPFTIIRQDITKMDTDTIVNAANTDLAMGGGVCGAIFRAAGAARLQAACNKLAPIKTGEAAATPGFDLPCKYIIHTAGPVYRQWNAKESERLLRSSYTESLKLASKKGCESIAFPLISSGIYGYPKAEALKVATEAVRDYLKTHDMTVYLTVFDKNAFTVSETLMGSVKSFIDENYLSEHCVNRKELLSSGPKAQKTPQVYMSAAPMPAAADSLDCMISELDEPFSDALLRLIDAKGKTDVEVYKRANLDRKLFSKIRSVKGYMPGKRTVIALAIALELDINETDELLKRAGYALSRSQKFDVIIEYFIINSVYDVYQINEVLFEYDQPLLGS